MVSFKLRPLYPPVLIRQTIECAPQQAWNWYWTLFRYQTPYVVYRHCADCCYIIMSMKNELSNGSTLTLQCTPISRNFLTISWLMCHNVRGLSLQGQNICWRFNFLLTVHHAMILGNCPTWRTNSFQCIYLFIALYMFPACHAHHQEKRIVSIQLLVIVIPCWWQCRVVPTSTRHCHQHGMTITRSCIDTIRFSWWWAWHAGNM